MMVIISMETGLKPVRNVESRFPFIPSHKSTFTI